MCKALIAKLKQTESNEDSSSSASASKVKLVDHNKEEIKNRTVMSLIISFLILVVNFFVHLYFLNYWKDSESLLSLAEILYSLFNSLTGVFIGISISSLALDFFSYIKYSQDRIKEVMIDKTYLNTLADEEKRRVIASLESSLYFRNSPIPEDSLYVNIKSKIAPLLDEPYLENYFLHIDCFIDDKNKLISKNMTHKMEIYSVRDNLSFSLPFSVYIDKVGGSSYKVTSLSFSKSPVSDFSPEDFVGCLQVTDERRKEVEKHHINYDFTLSKGKNEISYTSESIVDISDISFVHNLTMPCKHYIAEISMHSPEYTVRGCGFAIDKQKTMEINYFENTCRIEFTDWTIPGDGIIFYFIKK